MQKWALFRSSPLFLAPNHNWISIEHSKKNLIISWNSFAFQFSKENYTTFILFDFQESFLIDTLAISNPPSPTHLNLNFENFKLN